MMHYPTIDMKATGSNIVHLRKTRGFSVRELQQQLGFMDPQAIYKWQWGKTLPSIDNLVILSCIFEVPIDRILVVKDEGPVPFLGFVFIIPGLWYNSEFGTYIDKEVL